MTIRPDFSRTGRWQAVFLHLRLPFSYFLLPVFLFALSESSDPDLRNTLLIFITLHFLIYPGSNLYNSYMDKDTGSIGVLKNPPPATKDLFYASIFFDVAGLLLASLISFKMSLLLVIYIAVSKAYSWKKIRFKKEGISGWLIVILFQGAYTFMISHMAASSQVTTQWFTEKNIIAMLIATILIGAYYPLTQIYQHDEDIARGDKTISYRLGIRGTFVFTLLLFLLATALAYYYFVVFYALPHFHIFILSLSPAILYFLNWFRLSVENESNADFDHTMRMTFISSTCMIICFSLLMLINRGG